MNFKTSVVLSLCFFLTIGLTKTSPLLGQEKSWSNEFILPGVSGPVIHGGNDAYINDVIFTDEGVYITGSFTSVENVKVNNIAFWDGNEWGSLGEGFGYRKAYQKPFGNQLLDDDRYLYVVGSFNWAGDIDDINNVAVWDKELEIWASLSSGVDTVAHTIAKNDSSILVGGTFTEAGGKSIPYLASWDGGEWTSVRDNATFNGPVYTLETIDDVLYVGGDFTKIGDASLIRIARLVKREWFDVGGTSNGPVYDIHPIGDSIFIGGLFSKLAGFDIHNLGFLDKNGWNGFKFSPDSTVKSIAGSSYTDLMVAGEFIAIDGNAVSGLGHWNGTSWTQFDHIDQNFSFGSVNTVLEDNERWIIAGDFQVAQDIAVGNIASLTKDTFSWSTFGSDKPFNGINGDVKAMAVDGNDIYVGGTFRTIGDKAISYLAKWDGEEWTSFGTIPNSPGPIVYDILIDGDKIYITGFIDAINKSHVAHVAVFDKSTEQWSSLGTGLNAYGTSLAMYGDTLVVGGAFTAASGVDANRIAGWDIGNQTWIDFDLGFNGPIWDVSVQNQFIFVGGSFTTAGEPLKGISNFSKWVPDLGKWINIGKVNNAVYTIFPTDSIIYYGGVFDTTESIQTMGIASLDETGSEPYKQLGDGIQGSVSASTSIGDTLYVGGSFSNSGPTSMFRIGAWDGSKWNSLGLGIQGGTVRTLATDGEHIYAGGTFTGAGGVVSRGLAKWTPAKTPIVSTEEFNSGISLFSLEQNYPNPFNPSTNISFTIASADQVSLTVFNLLGQKVATLINKKMNAGTHRVSFNASSLSSGVYIYKLDTTQGRLTKKMLLIK